VRLLRGARDWRKTLVITTKEDIYKQWLAGAQKFLGLAPDEIGEIRQDKCEVPRPEPADRAGVLRQLRQPDGGGRSRLPGLLGGAGPRDVHESEGRA
jgi:hypothetical protein